MQHPWKCKSRPQPHHPAADWRINPQPARALSALSFSCQTSIVHAHKLSMHPCLSFLRALVDIGTKFHNEKVEKAAR